MPCCRVAFVKVTYIVGVNISDTLLITYGILLEYQSHVYSTLNIP